MSVIQAVKAHSRLIQFPTRVKWSPNLNFPAITVSQPTAIESESVVPKQKQIPSLDAPDTIEVFRVIPDRYRRRPVDLFELEYIQNGGPV